VNELNEKLSIRSRHPSNGAPFTNFSTARCDYCISAFRYNAPMIAQPPITPPKGRHNPLPSQERMIRHLAL